MDQHEDDKDKGDKEEVEKVSHDCVDLPIDHEAVVGVGNLEVAEHEAAPQGAAASEEDEGTENIEHEAAVLPAYIIIYALLQNHQTYSLFSIMKEKT